MALYLITGIFWITCFAVVSYALPVTDQDDAALYLKKFGYLPESAGSFTDREKVTAAIRDFQRFAGLTETGVLDRTTITMMNTPRCGVKDKIRHSSRKKRYALEGSKWSEKELTYHISKYSSKFTDNTIVKNEMARAFKIWSDVTSLNFKENPSGQANIDIRFEVGHHRDGYGFDGPGGTLAHAFFPQYGGAAHFDDAETWTINENYGNFYWEVLSNGIAAGYPRKISDNWGGLEGNLDAAVSATGKTYFFKGIHYWRFTEKNMDRGYPKLISYGFQGAIPDNLNAAFVWSNGKAYFFKGDQYWRWDFYSNLPDSTGYPQHIREWSSALVDGIDAAVKWDNNRTYFFKDDQYYRYNDVASNVDEYYPVPTGTGWFGC